MHIETLEKGLADALKKEFKTDDLVACLTRIGVLQPHEKFIAYKDLTPWARGGAETYCAVSALATDQREIKFIAKALVSMATKPERQLSDWNRRRAIIQSLGINTPKLFSTGNGVIYEEYIDNEFLPSRDLPNDVLIQLAHIARSLDQAGFVTRSFTRDIREKGGILYYIDFGSDLGDPAGKEQKEAWEHLYASCSVEQLAIMRYIYLDI